MNKTGYELLKQMMIKNDVNDNEIMSELILRYDISDNFFEDIIKHIVKERENNYINCSEHKLTRGYPDYKVICDDCNFTYNCETCYYNNITNFYLTHRNQDEITKTCNECKNDIILYVCKNCKKSSCYCGCECGCSC